MGQWCRTVGNHITLTNTNHCSVFNESLLGNLGYDHSSVLFFKMFSIIVFSLSCYMFISIGIYELRNTSQSTAVRVNYLSFVATFLNVVFSARVVLDYFSHAPSTTFCKAMSLTGGVSYVIGTGLLYTLLWARQRKFHTDPLMKTASNKYGQACSSVLILSMYANLIGVVSLLQQNYCLIPTQIGCFVVWNDTMAQTTVPMLMAVFVVICFVCQILFFTFTTQPLLKVRKRFFCACLTWKSDKEIHRLLKRLVISTCSCVTTSLIMSCLVMLDSTPMMCVNWLSLVQLDFFANNLAVVISFINWKERLFPLIWINCSRKSVAAESSCQVPTSFKTTDLINDDCCGSVQPGMKS